MLMKAFVFSQFSYCLPIWIFHSRKMKHDKQHPQERFEDSHGLTFQELLAKDKLVSVHQKNLQLLVTKIFKSKTGVLPELIHDVFHFVESPYNLRSDYTLKRKRDHTVYHDSQNLSSLALKLWDLVLNSIKNSAFLK